MLMTEANKLTKPIGYISIESGSLPRPSRYRSPVSAMSLPGLGDASRAESLSAFRGHHAKQDDRGSDLALHRAVGFGPRRTHQAEAPCAGSGHRFGRGSSVPGGAS